LRHRGFGSHPKNKRNTAKHGRTRRGFRRKPLYRKAAYLAGFLHYTPLAIAFHLRHTGYRTAGETPKTNQGGLLYGKSGGVFPNDKGVYCKGGRRIGLVYKPVKQRCRLLKARRLWRWVAQSSHLAEMLRQKAETFGKGKAGVEARKAARKAKSEVREAESKHSQSKRNYGKAEKLHRIWLELNNE